MSSFRTGICIAPVEELDNLIHRNVLANYEMRPSGKLRELDLGRNLNKSQDICRSIDCRSNITVDGKTTDRMRMFLIEILRSR